MKIEFGFELFNNFKDLYFLIDENGDILRANKTVKDFYAPDEIEGKNFYKLVEITHREKVKLQLLECFRSEENIELFLVLNTKDSTIDLVANTSVIKQNENCYLLLQAKDITEQRKKELELLQFYYVAENTINPLQITDISGNMIYVNPAFIKASGYSKDELLGKNPKIFGSKKHSKSFWKEMWETILSGKTWYGEVENKRKDGEPFYTQLLVSPIVNSNNQLQGFFGIHRDISDKKLLEKQLIHTQKMESIGTLAAGVAHEVGNPLASISAIVQVIQRYSKDPFIIERLGLVKNQVTRISKIIRDLVDFSRPSNYKLQLTDINENIREAIEIVRIGAKAKQIEFQQDLSSNIPLLPLIADQIQQIFVNILLNAVDAINEKQNSSRNFITVKSEILDNFVMLTFSDSGTGIKEENIGKVFEPFFTTKREGKGTGLGLWVSYGIIKSFKGDIEVKSLLGKGTTFIIKLPINRS